MKIYCIEKQKKGFDKKTFEELQDMIGYIEPNVENNTWDVTLIGECGFSCKTQETAQLMASLEEIKAMLMQGVDEKENVK